MAGEIEDFNISFQADSIHSGSISFGRFESEPLSWERRSSFSHNRYLEEVERCSKPGSVNEKKALLEAHFKKMLLQQQDSIVHENSQCETSQNQNDGEEIKHQDEYDDSCHCDESPISSDYNGEIEVTHAEIQSCAFSSFRSDENLMQHGIENVQDSFHEEFSTKELYYTENACDVISGSPSGVMEISQSLEGDQNKIGSTFESIHRSANCNDAEIIDENNSYLQHPSSESAPKVDIDPKKLISKPQPSVTSSPSYKLNKKSEAPESKTSRMIRGATNRANIKAWHSTTNSCSEASREKDMAISGQDIENRKTKPVSESGRTKEEKEKKIAESQHLSPKMSHSNNLSKRRVKATANPSKTEIKTGAGGFGFKCEERAERRKEFNMKLEKKMHAKENEISQIEAKKQEKKEAEIKQFRKSLNFKATPMPSFYHATMQQRSDGTRASSSKANSPIKAGMKSPSPHKEIKSREVSSSRAGSSQVGVSKSSTATDFISDLNTSSLGPSVDQKPPTEASSGYKPARMAEAGEKRGKDKQREKERSKNMMVKKDMKSVRMSRTGNIAVGVTS